MSWRECLAEMKERVELLRREVESGDGRHIEALSITQDRNLPRLIGGLRLCTEAWCLNGEGTPSANNMYYCPGCGRRITMEELWREGDGDDGE